MKWNKQIWLVGFSLIVLAVASRLLPHWHNFTAVGGASLFGAYFFKKKIWAYLVPLIAMWISDIVLNNIVYTAFNDGFILFSRWMIGSYLGFMVMVLIGQLAIKKLHMSSVLFACVAGTMAFFLITNFGSFLFDPLYLKTPSHLGLAYVAGLPFLLNTFLANVFFAGIFFGAYALTVRDRSQYLKATS